MRQIKYLFLIIIVSAAAIFAQNKDFELGADASIRFQQQSGNFNFSDPEALNIKVAVWGWVKYPGRYTVPVYTTVSDLLSYAGGPTDATNLDDLRLYRGSEEAGYQLINFSYGDVFSEKNLSGTRKIPKLEAGDILVVPGEPKIYAREKVSMWTSIFSGLISLTILIINIVK